MSQIVLLHQPADFFLRLLQFARVHGGGLDGERLLELGLKMFVGRLRGLQLRAQVGRVPSALPRPAAAGRPGIPGLDGFIGGGHHRRMAFEFGNFVGDLVSRNVTMLGFQSGNSF